jgi:hypothetical protein
MGWHEDASKRSDLLCHLIQLQHGTNHSNQLELCFQQKVLEVLVPEHSGRSQP